MSTRTDKRKGVRRPFPGVISVGLLLPLVLWAPMTHPAASGAGQEEYHGKYATSPEAQKYSSQLPALRREALSVVCERLGLRYKDMGSIRLRLADLPEGENLTARRRTEEKDGREIQLIEFFMEPLVGGKVRSLRHEAIHEMTHAVMRDLMGTSYIELPRWLTEGLAVYVSGDGVERLQDRLAVTDEPSSVVDGLETESRDLEEYVEDYLAVEFLVKKGGEDALRDLCSRLIKGQECMSAIKAVTGLDEEEFREGFRAYGKRRCRDAAGPLHERFREMVAKTRRRKPTRSSVKELKRFLEDHPDSYFALAGSYELGRGYYRLGEFETAIPLIRRGWSSPRFAAGGRYWVAKAYYKLHRYSAAIEGFRGFLRDFPYSDNSGSAHLFLGHSLQGKRMYALAGAHYEMLLAGYPKNRYAPDARYSLGLVDLKGGDRGAAAKHFEACIRDYPGSEAAKAAAKKLGRIRKRDK